MSDPVICPKCGVPRPTAEQYEAGQAVFEAAWLAHRVCCNPLCRGLWGTGCFHCHDPSYYTAEAQLALHFASVGYADPRSTASAITAWTRSK